MGFVFWAAGFGILHIVYGAYMWWKYERQPKIIIYSMKNPIENLNKIFDSRIRMGVMSILVVNEEVSFNDLNKCWM